MTNFGTIKANDSGNDRPWKSNSFFVFLDLPEILQEYRNKNSVFALLAANASLFVATSFKLVLTRK